MVEPSFSVVEDEVEDGLGVVAGGGEEGFGYGAGSPGHVFERVARPVIERVGEQEFGEDIGCGAGSPGHGASRLLQDECF